MEVSGRAFQAEKRNVYKPGGKNEVGGSIEEMVSPCGAIMGTRGKGRDLLYYFITPTQVYTECYTNPAISTDLLTVTSNLPCLKHNSLFSS